MIFIPTHNRVGRQKTIKLFPPETWGTVVSLVHTQNEDHGDYPSIVIDDENGSMISKKRQWILDYGRSNDLEWMGMMDDYMTRRIVSDKTFYETFMCAVDQFVDSSLDMMYFNHAFMSNKRNVLFDDPCKLVEELVITSNTYLIKPNRIPHTVNFLSDVYEDAHFGLSVMEHGLNVGFYCDLMMSPVIVNKVPGGNRDAPEFTDHINENLERFRDLHPRYVSLMSVDAGTGSRGSNYKLKVYSKRAWLENRPNPLQEFIS
jgi:hypothetical protein